MLFHLHIIDAFSTQKTIYYSSIFKSMESLLIIFLLKYLQVFPIYEIQSCAACRLQEIHTEHTSFV